MAASDDEKNKQNMTDKQDLTGDPKVLDPILALSTDEIRGYDYQKIFNLVGTLETNASNITATPVNAQDKYPDYIEKVHLIQELIASGKYPELEKDSSLKTSMLLRLSGLDSLLSRLGSIIKILAEQSDKLTKQSDRINDISNSLVEKQEAIANLEHKTLTHTMTLMGVFSAIITIVMSLVSTSASWLSNANGASAMLAFLVPTAVGVFSVSVLLLMVYGYNTISVSSTEGYQEKRGRYIGFFTASVVVMVLFGALLGLAVSHHTSEESQVLHLRYALSPGQYDTVERDGVYYYSFEIDGRSYVLECNDTYSHDGILYYCSEHNKLE